MICREKMNAGPAASEIDVMNSLREQKNNYKG